MDEKKEQPIVIKLDLETAIEYFTERRDDALEHFNDVLKTNNYTVESIHRSLDTVLRTNEQLKLMEDCLVMLRITQSSNERLKTTK
jgi:glutaredoxin 2